MKLKLHTIFVTIKRQVDCQNDICELLLVSLRKGTNFLSFSTFLPNSYILSWLSSNKSNLRHKKKSIWPWWSFFICTKYFLTISEKKFTLCSLLVTFKPNSFATSFLTIQMIYFASFSYKLSFKWYLNKLNISKQ